jgi:hypothetical protein
MFRVGVETPAATASELYAILRPRLGEPRRTPSADSSPGRPLPPLAFLGALQAGLKRAAALAGRPANLAQARVEFVHNGSVRQLELLSLKRDPGRGRRLAGRGFVRNVNDVFTLEYRITSGRRTDGGFRMWVELPASGHDNADAPIVPLGWEFEMRSFLRLSAERTY